LLDDLFWLEPVDDHAFIVHFLSAMIDDLLECPTERAYVEFTYELGDDRLVVSVAFSENRPSSRTADGEYQIWTAQLERAADSIILRVPDGAYLAAALGQTSRATWAYRGARSFSIVIFSAESVLAAPTRQ
jgi:hypothetical protein